MKDHSQCLGPTLGWAAQLAKAAIDARVSPYDVTPVQTHILLYLHHHGGQALQHELTGYLRVKPSTVNGLLDRMEEKGLVRRMTEKGVEQQILSQKSFLDVEDAIVRGFSPEEKETLIALLDRVIQNLKEDSET